MKQAIKIDREDKSIEELLTEVMMINRGHIKEKEGKSNGEPIEIRSKDFMGLQKERKNNERYKYEF